jgi:hypothetical protein
MKDVFFELNIKLLMNNPVSGKYYLILLVVRTLIMIVLPFAIIVKHEAAIDIQRSYNYSNNQNLYVALLIGTSSISFLLLISYAALLLRLRIISKNKHSHNKGGEMRTLLKVVMASLTI